MEIQKELISEFEKEAASARKMLEAIPSDADFAYKPHPKSMSLGRLAEHLGETLGQWALSTLTLSELIFPADHKFGGELPASKDELLAKFDKGVAETKAELVKFAPEKWDDNWKFGMGDQIWLNDTKYRIFRICVLNHMIHHRAQLGVYLRLLDKPIPGTYGPSADEMANM